MNENNDLIQYDELYEKFKEGLEILGINEDEIKNYIYIGQSNFSLEEIKKGERRYHKYASHLIKSGISKVECKYIYDRDKKVCDSEYITLPELPPRQERCICNHKIEINCYIFNKSNNQMLIIGTECVKKFTKKGTKQVCYGCGETHLNRKNDLCKECRKEKCWRCYDSLQNYHSKNKTTKELYCQRCRCKNCYWRCVEEQSCSECRKIVQTHCRECYPGWCKKCHAKMKESVVNNQKEVKTKKITSDSWCKKCKIEAKMRHSIYCAMCVCRRCKSNLKEKNDLCKKCICKDCLHTEAIKIGGCCHECACEGCQYRVKIKDHKICSVCVCKRCNLNLKNENSIYCKFCACLRCGSEINGLCVRCLCQECKKDIIHENWKMCYECLGKSGIYFICQKQDCENTIEPLYGNKYCHEH